MERKVVCGTLLCFSIIRRRSLSAFNAVVMPLAAPGDDGNRYHPLDCPTFQSRLPFAWTTMPGTLLLSKEVIACPIDDDNDDRHRKNHPSENRKGVHRLKET